MLYTGKGDKGTTKLFDCPQGTRLAKSAFVFEVLGSLDELNSCLGFAKALSLKSKIALPLENSNKPEIPLDQIIETLQQNIFCIQAEIGGSDIHVTQDHILYLNSIIDSVEKNIPPITSFIVPGGGQTSAYLDVVRTVTRRTEREVIKLRDGGERKVSDESIAYLNRLSSVLYALARFANFKEGFVEGRPRYE